MSAFRAKGQTRVHCPGNVIVLLLQAPIGTLAVIAHGSLHEVRSPKSRKVLERKPAQIVHAWECGHRELEAICVYSRAVHLFGRGIVRVLHSLGMQPPASRAS